MNPPSFNSALKPNYSSLTQSLMNFIIILVMIYFLSYYTSFDYFYFKIFYLKTQILEQTVRQALARKAPAWAKLSIA